mmetsp:Transcript_49943/g.125833  ORF Transcript_49943/g.125833 Transcript_49943/m.125833 type:complete len:234 (+) Transcript_49943:595-1296(+)
MRTHDAWVDGDAILEGDSCWVRAGPPQGKRVVAGVCEVGVLYRGVQNLAVQVDPICLGGSGNHIVDEEVPSASIVVAGLRDPDTYLSRANAVRLAETTLVAVVVALGVARHMRTDLRLVLRKVVIVQANILNSHIDGSIAIRAAVVHIGAAIVGRATLGFKCRPSAKCAIVIGPDGVNTLIAQVTHGNVAIQDEPYTCAHHIRRIAIVHVVICDAPSCQKQCLLRPIRALRRI